MKIECEVICDLLPLYAEEMVSERTKEAVEEHFLECEACKNKYKQMILPEPQVKYSNNPASSFKKYIKKKKWSVGLKAAFLTAAVIIAAVVLRLVMMGGFMSFFLLDSVFEKVEVDTNSANYLQYMGSGAKEEYRSKWGMDETIFPAKITEEMNVKDYKMVYYNPWDAQYLSYLVVDYDETDYKKEVERLSAYESKDYIGYYGVTGFDKEYALLAVNADSYQGFVYALTDGNSQIIYVEIIFCNYFMDIDYKKYIDEKYLPIGFDATQNNDYRKKIIQDKK